MTRRWLAAALALACAWRLVLPLAAQPVVSLVSPAQAGAPAELRVAGAPVSSNPFDPEIIRLDATLTTPAGRTLVIPGFWFQNYARALVNGAEQLTPFGAPEWRVRCLPLEHGTYSVAVQIATNGRAWATSAPLSFTATLPAAAPALAGIARTNASGTGFANGDGSALGLVGANVCWPGARGTYDYDDWFPALAANHGNYARLWMWPYEFGIENAPGTLTHYRLDRAWKLDRLFTQAGALGIRLMLCLDYHGMFATTPDPTFGGGDDWKVNPYNTANGGPCGVPNAFFTNSVARTTYLKRLRYLVARFGANPSLFSWEFFNEIDNEYSVLQPADVAAWHASTAAWLHTNDPWGHLVTTSLTGGSDRSDIWGLPQLDYAQYHSYNEPSPAARLQTVAQTFLTQYRKPVVVAEFGVDYRGWMRAADPYLRGFRQGVWGGALGGSAGTAMSWWWENLYSEGVYPLLGAVRDVLAHSRWPADAYRPLGFQSSGPPPPAVGDLLGGAPFTVTLIPGAQWGGKPAGALAIANPDAANYAASSLNAFVQGTAHPDLRVPFKLDAWFGAAARVVPHVDSVSTGAILGVYVDNSLVLRTNLPDKDGLYNPTANEYNIDIPVAVAAGRHTVELRNLGVDWLYLDYVRVEQAEPSAYAGGWTPSPAAIGLQGPSDALVYVVAPNLSYPAGATNPAPPLAHGQPLVLTNWPAGQVVARWYNPTNAAPMGESVASAVNGVLTLTLPDFAEDLAGILIAPPSLLHPTRAGAGFQFQVTGPPGYPFVVDGAADLRTWTPGTTGIFSSLPQPVSEVATNAAGFYRVRLVN